MKIANFLLVSIVSVLLITSPANAEQAADEPKLKSLTTARVLSFMPLNSPTLFYVQRPIRGVGYTVLEGGGITFMAFGAYFLAAAAEPDNTAFGSAIREQILLPTGLAGVGIGFVSWFYPWIKTVVNTEEWVDDCNEKILDKAKKVSLGTFDKGYGVNLTYRF